MVYCGCSFFTFWLTILNTADLSCQKPVIVLLEKCHMLLPRRIFVMFVKLGRLLDRYFLIIIKPIDYESVKLLMGE